MPRSAEAQSVRFRTLCDVTRIITSSLDLTDVLQRICAHAADLLHADVATLAILNHDEEGDDQGELEIVAETPDRSTVGARLALDGSLNGQALRERRTLIVNDLPADARVDHEVAGRLGAQRAVVAPLVFGDAVLGTLAVANTRSDSEFDQDDAEILDVLAGHAAVAIRNAELHESSQARLQGHRELEAEQEKLLHQLRSLIRSGMALNERSTLDDVLQTLVDATREVLAARYAALGVLDSTGASLSRFVVSGVDPDLVDRIGAPPTGRGTLGIMLRGAETVRIDRLQDHPEFEGFPPHHPTMTSLLGVPIRAGGRVFGNLYASEKTSGERFTQQDQDLLGLLASQAAIAIQNQRLSEERRRFVAIVNHEIKNAAAGVLGWTDRLRSLTAETERRIRESAAYAHEGSQHLHKLVTDLLEFSRLDSRTVELEERDVDLRALVREVAASSRPAAEEEGIDVRLSSLEERAVVRTDPARARQILLNLLSNAIKYTPPDGEIEISLDQTEGAWSITVRDSGPGVDPEIRDRIFEAYGARATSKRGGAGLGLAISRQLAHMLGGRLDLVDPGPGAAFRLQLPDRTSDP